MMCVPSVCPGQGAEPAEAAAALGNRLQKCPGDALRAQRCPWGTAGQMWGWAGLGKLLLSTQQIPALKPCPVQLTQSWGMLCPREQIQPNCAPAPSWGHCWKTSTHRGEGHLPCSSPPATWMGFLKIHCSNHKELLQRITWGNLLRFQPTWSLCFRTRRSIMNAKTLWIELSRAYFFPPGSCDNNNLIL